MIQILLEPSEDTMELAENIDLIEKLSFTWKAEAWNKE